MNLEKRHYHSSRNFSSEESRFSLAADQHVEHLRGKSQQLMSGCESGLELMLVRLMECWFFGDVG